MIPYTLRQLETFVGIYEEGSFNQAARRLNATQSGLSVQIKQLEAYLDVTLFERSSRGVLPTLAGEKLYQTAVTILRELDATETALKKIDGTLSGNLRVGLMPTFTRSLLAPVLTSFTSRYPDVEVAVTEAYSAVLLEQVADGRVDFAIVPRGAARPGCTARPFAEDCEIVVARAGGDRPHLAPMRLQDLDGGKLVLPFEGNARRTRLDSAMQSAGVRPAAVIAMDAMIATLDLVATSDFVTILPTTICTKDLSGETRFLHPLADPPLRVEYEVVERASRAPGRAAAVFLDALDEAYRASWDRWSGIIGAATGASPDRLQTPAATG